MRNAGLDEAQTGIKAAGRNINNLRYVDDTTLMAEREEEIKSLLMKVKEESERVGLKLNIQWERDTCTPMFIAALFLRARTWKQPRCTSADEWVRKRWYIHTMEYYSAIKKNSFESVLMRWMKLEPIIHSEVCQNEKHQCNVLTHICEIWKDGNDNPMSKTAKET